MNGYELTSVNNPLNIGTEIFFSDLSTLSLVFPTKQEAAPMAREVIETYKDDLDGTSAEHIGVRFGFQNEEFTIDLSDENFAALKAALEPFTKHATRVSGSGRGRGRSASTGSASNKEKKDELAAIRSWAEANNVEIAARGRIKESIIHAYQQNDPSLVGG